LLAFLPTRNAPLKDSGARVEQLAFPLRKLHRMDAKLARQLVERLVAFERLQGDTRLELAAMASAWSAARRLASRSLNTHTSRFLWLLIPCFSYPLLLLTYGAVQVLGSIIKDSGRLFHESGFCPCYELLSHARTRAATEQQRGGEVALLTHVSSLGKKSAVAGVPIYYPLSPWERGTGGEASYETPAVSRFASGCQRRSGLRAASVWSSRPTGVSCGASRIRSGCSSASRA